MEKLRKEKGLSQEELAELMQTYSSNANATYDSNLTKLGVVDLNKPSTINLYPKYLYLLSSNSLYRSSKLFIYFVSSKVNLILS